MRSIILIVLLLSFSLYAQNGVISGRVVDSKTEEALVGANVIVNELNNTGAAANESGFFSIPVPTGTYTLTVSLIGFKPVVKTDVVVKTGREAMVLIKLTETSLELDQVTITADYFDKALVENDLSTVVLSAEEIRRSPGSSQDFQRILQGMAGVSFSNDQNNELIVRGGSPNENLTVYDNMEIHSTNHYPNDFNSGGPINMVNVDLIQDIQFSTGGFISKYGDKLSSVLNVSTREGSRNRYFAGNANLSMAGYGLVSEGKINGGKGSWILSARNSYIDMIAGSFGLTAIPYYYDVQGKVVYDLSDKHKLSLSGIYGNDRINLEGTSSLELASMANRRDTVNSSGFDVKQHQYAIGLTLKSLWSKSLYSLTTISKNNYNSKVNITSDYVERIFDSAGKVDETNVIEKKMSRSIDSDNGETAFRTEFVWNPSPTNELSVGGALKFVQFTSLQSIDADTVRYDMNGDGNFDQTVLLPYSELDYKFDFFEHNKSYFFINEKLKLFNERLVVNAGVRYDYFSYSEKGYLSPRFSASYYVVPDLTSLNFAYGEFYQTQSLPIYGDRFQTEINRYLENSRSRHFVAGIEHVITDGLRANLEGYYKKYDDMPVREDFIHHNDRTFRSEKVLNIGEAEVYGIDFSLQQKLVEDIYGTLSFSRMWTEYKDPRIGFEGNTNVMEYDFPYVVTIILGKRFTGLYSAIDELPGIISIPAKILPVSDDMEISLRWRYASGKPYTKQIYTKGEQHRIGGRSWSQGWWVRSDELLGERYPDYHRLDLAVNSRFNFNDWNIVLFLSIQNLYNRENIAFYQYSSDGSTETVYQFSFLPVGGVEIEF